MWRFLQYAVTALGMGLVVAAGGRATASDCLPWSAAGPVIAKNALIPANVIYNRVQSRAAGQIIHASLCPQGKRFVYKFTVLGAKGEVQTIALDAKTGR
jgi:uncharacterized membrane protein YkoI